MDKNSLISTFEEAYKSGWSLQADVQVLKWLEEFAERLKMRASNVTEDVYKLLEQTGDVEQDFYNTFNSFRALSNTQYIENRVNEDDEMSASNSDFSVQFSEASLPAQGYEEDIVPRYKEALVTGWNVYRQYIQKTSRNTSQATPYKVGWNNGQLPHIIGTEEFMRDNSCGLTDDRNLGLDPLDFNSDAEREGIHLEAEMAGSRTVLEANWPGTESDKDDQVGMEPAVSAALDFKAMLEAALRSPYIPYNDDFSNLNGTYSYSGNTGDGLVTSEVVTVDVLRNGSPNAPGKNSDVSSVSSALRGTENIPDVTTASTSTATVPRDSYTKSIVISQEFPAASLQRNISSKSLGATDRLDPSSFSGKLHTSLVSGGLFESADDISTSSQNEYFQSMSQPVGIYQCDQHAKSNEKPQLRISSQPKQASSATEVKNDIYEPGSSSTSKISNAAVISGRSFSNEQEPSSSILQESDHLLSPSTAKSRSSILEDDDEKIVFKSTSRDGGRDIPDQKSHGNSSGSSNVSRHLQGTLFSGGLFDDEDELIFSSPVESVNVWSQPSVPDRLFGSISELKKDDVVQSSNMYTDLNQIEHNPPDGMIPTSIQVSAEDKHQFSAVENTEQTSSSYDHVDKSYYGNPSLKENLSLLQKGLFDDGDSDEDDDPGYLFRAHPSLGQKHKAHDGALVSGSNLMQGLSNAGITLNVSHEMHANLTEIHKDDEPHKIDVESSRRTETVSSAGQIISSDSTTVQNAGYENAMSDLDNSNEISPAVNLTEYAVDPEKIPLTSTVLPLHKLETLPHSVPEISRHNQSDGDSDSWSSSSSEKDIKHNTILDISVKATSDSISEINDNKFEKVVLEAQGFSHPAGDIASVLEDGETGNLAESASLLDPNNDGPKYISDSKGDMVQKGISIPVRPAEFESLLSDKHIEESRLEATTLTTISNPLFEATVSYANESKVAQPRVEDQAAAMRIVDVDIPKRTGSQSGDWQTESLWRNNDPVWHPSEHSLAELHDQSKDGRTVLPKSVPASEAATGNFTDKENLNSMPSTSVSNKNHESDVLSGLSDKETKGKLTSNVLSQPVGLTDTPLSSPLKETKAPPSRHILLFGDEDEEMEASLFGPLPKAIPKGTPLLKTPVKRLSLFDSDED